VLLDAGRLRFGSGDDLEYAPDGTYLRGSMLRRLRRAALRA
jgi:hypothetical protein